MFSNPLIFAFVIVVVLFVSLFIFNFNNHTHKTIYFCDISSEKKLIKLALYYNRELYRQTSDNTKKLKIREDSEWMSRRQAYIWMFEKFNRTIQARLVIESIAFTVLFFLILGLLYVLYLKHYSAPLEALCKSLDIYTREKRIDDVTIKAPGRLKKILENFNQLLKRLDQKNEIEKLINSLRNWKNGAALVVHEIKNKLTPISISLACLNENSDLKENQSHDIRMVQDKIREIQTLVWNFRELSQLPVPAPLMLNLNHLLQEILRNNKMEKFINIHKPFPEIILFSDPVFLEIILVNLFKNGLDSYKDNDIRIDLKRQALYRERETLLDEVLAGCEIIGTSEPVQKLKEQIRKYAHLNESILITGESGS